jgi:hypothetical protein
VAGYSRFSEPYFVGDRAPNPNAHRTAAAESDRVSSCHRAAAAGGEVVRRQRTCHSVDEYHCCSATLTVVGDDLDPAAVTTALGWSPDKSWRRGEHKRFTRDDGTDRVFDSVHDSGGWKRFGSAEERERSLQDQVAAWLDRLRGKGPVLRDLWARGWEVELDCFAATSEYLHLPTGLMTELAGLGVDLAITFSADGRPDAAEPVRAPDRGGGE